MKKYRKCRINLIVISDKETTMIDKTLVYSAATIAILSISTMANAQQLQSPITSNLTGPGIKNSDGRILIQPRSGLYTVTRKNLVGGIQKTYLCLGSPKPTGVTVPYIGQPLNWGLFNVPQALPSSSISSGARFKQGEIGAFANVMGLYILASGSLNIKDAKTSSGRASILFTALSTTKILGVDAEVAMDTNIKDIGSSIKNIIGGFQAEWQNDSKGICSLIK